MYVSKFKNTWKHKKWLLVFTDVCNTWREAAELHNDVLSMIGEAGLNTDAREIPENKTPKPKPVKMTSGKQSGGQPETADGKVGPDTPIEESLSRGSLYRRRYYGRY